LKWECGQGDKVRRGKEWRQGKGRSRDKKEEMRGE
jgi:hypothetical protein